MTDQPSEAELIARGLYDPEASNAAEMLAFLRETIERGVDIAAMEEFGPSFALVKHMLRPGDRYTLAEAAKRAGVSIDMAAKLSRASGLALPAENAPTFTDEDVEVFAAFGMGSEIFGEALIMQIVRVIGASTARIAEAAVSQFTLSLGAQAAQGPLTEIDIARWNETTVSMLPIVVRTIDILIRRHIEARGRSDLLITEWEGIDTIDRAFGFCDLVGYTAFSEKVTAQDLDAAVGSFGNTASDIVLDTGGSVVKLIGDEVMFVAPDAATACAIGLALATAFDADPRIPDVRVGLAAGQVVLREGDFYGPVVNLAARVVKQSAPGVVLAPATFRELAPGFTFSDAGSHELKGFVEDVALVVVER